VVAGGPKQWVGEKYKPYNQKVRLLWGGKNRGTQGDFSNGGKEDHVEICIKVCN